uniref:Neurotensin/neuromedin N n=1 Tax=Oncorhynchus mykiss TaxID=8022 RepID=A0A8C7RFD8_ONCMY
VNTMLCNQIIDMPHLSGGWIILSKEKCSLTGINKLFVLDGDRNRDNPLKRKSPYIFKRQVKNTKARRPYILKRSTFY